MKVTADLAFLLLLAGIAGITLELARPGYLWPGVLGAGAGLAGAYLLCAGSSDPVLLAMVLVIAAALFAAAWWSPVRFATSGAAALILVAAIWRCSGIHVWLLLPGTIGVTGGMVYLISQAKRARQNKAV